LLPRHLLLRLYLLGVGVGTGVDSTGVGAGVGAGIGVDSTGVAEGVETGELSGFGEGEGLALAALCFVLTWCLEEWVVPLPAFSSVFPVFFSPLPTVRSVACAPCSIVWPVFFAAFSTVCPVFSTGPWSWARTARDTPNDRMMINARCLIG
jgi:hypothetical protein